MRETQRKFWSDNIIPLLRSDDFQRFLQQHDPSDLQLKLNSHWVFANLMYKLDKEQDQPFTPSEIEDNCLEIDCLVGLPSKLLWVYHHATRQSLERPRFIDDHCYLYHELLKLRPTLSSRVDISPREESVIKETAQAYVHAAQLYVLCRIER